MGSRTQGKEHTLLKIFPNRRYFFLFLNTCVDQCQIVIPFTDDTISDPQVTVQTNDYKCTNVYFQQLNLNRLQ